MNRKNRKQKRSFGDYIRETYKNKLAAIALLTIGYVAILVDRDATLFVIMMAFAGPLFFAKHNCLY